MEILMRTALTNAMSASLLATVVAAVGLILSRRPAILHCLWVIVLVKLLTPPMLEVPLSNPRTAEPAFEAEAAPLLIGFESTESSTDVYPPLQFAAEPPEAAEPIAIVRRDAVEATPPWVEPATLWALLGVVWLGGSLVTSALAVVRVRSFQRLLLDAEPAEPEVEDEVAALSAAMGVRRPPAVVFIDGRLTPLLWAIGRPRLVVPRTLWKGLDARRRRLLLTHELAHLRRGDHWLRLFELAVTIAYWWLPVVWWVRRALRDVEEQCCDAWVVWMFPDEARTYAETLLDTVDFLNPVAKPEPLLASGFGAAHHLRRRLTMVMLGTTPRTLGWSGTLGALALAGVLLPMSPTWAQKAEEPVESADASSAKNPVFVEVSEDGRARFRTIGKSDADRDGDDALVLSAHLDDLLAAEPGDDGEGSKDEKSGEKEKTKEKRILFRKADSPEARTEGIQKAIDKLTARIEEIASKVSKEQAGKEHEHAEKALQELKAAKERLQKIAEETRRAKAARDSADAKPSDRVIVTQGSDLITKDLKGGAVTIRRADGSVLTTDSLILEGKGRDGGIRVGRAGDGKTSKADPKQLEEARHRIDELSKEIAVKQKQLREAHLRFAELQGWGRKEFRLGEIRVDGPGVVARSASRQDVRVAGRPEKKDRNDDDRLDALEKKLSKVLDELAGLKKEKNESQKH